MKPNADELLVYLQMGGVLKMGYVPRWAPIGKPKRRLILTLPDGVKIPVQRSAANALVKRGKVHAFYNWNGGETEYTLSEKASE
jgi:hypothetical protein